MIFEVPSNLSHSLILSFYLFRCWSLGKRPYVAFVYDQKVPCISPHIAYQKLANILQIPEYNSRELFKKDRGRKRNKMKKVQYTRGNIQGRKEHLWLGALMVPPVLSYMWLSHLPFKDSEAYLEVYILCLLLSQLLTASQAVMYLSSLRIALWVRLDSWHSFFFFFSQSQNRSHRVKKSLKMKRSSFHLSVITFLVPSSSYSPSFSTAPWSETQGRGYLA